VGERRTLGRILVLLALAAPLAGCGKGFIAWRDYPRVAECYGAFLSEATYAEDPGLAMSPDQVYAHQLTTMGGINRMTVYTLQAKERAGGDDQFIGLVARWRVKPENDIARAQTPEAKRLIYDHVLSQVRRCHESLSRWGAPPAISTPAQTAPAPKP
jgi:hypothetical protein